MKTPAPIQEVLDTASLSGRHVARLRGDFRSRLTAFQRHRSAEEQQELTEDFRRVLAAWGLVDADIPGVITALRLRLPVFAAPLLACLMAAAFRQGPAVLLTSALVTPPCLLGMITTLWRISILKTRRFLPLSHWLLSFRKRP